MTITQASRTAQGRNNWRTTINGLPMHAYTLLGINDDDDGVHGQHKLDLVYIFFSLGEVTRERDSGKTGK